MGCTRDKRRGGKRENTARSQTLAQRAQPSVLDIFFRGCKQSNLSTFIFIVCKVSHISRLDQTTFP